MTKLEELRIDLDLHEAAYEKLHDPDGRVLIITDVCFLIPSYVKIIASIKEEISSLEGKKKTKKTAKHE